jgi:uncharacterized membrane protein
MDPSLLGFPGLREVLNVHPVFVHFPIALFPSALLLYGLGIVAQRRSWCVAGRACLYLAAAGTALTILTGLQAEGTIPHNERIHHIMQTHKQIGYLIGAFAALLVGWSFVHREQRPRMARAFLVAMAATTYLALQNGDLGGRMVFVEGAGVKAAAPMMEGSHQHDAHQLEQEAPHHQEAPSDGHGHHDHEH